MRKPLLLGHIFALIVCQYGIVSAQESAVTQANVVLPDEVMQQVVSRILRYEFKSGRTKRTIPVADVRIRSEWFPVIKNVQFKLVPQRDIINYEKGVFLIDRIEKENGVYSIDVGWGDLDCSGSGTTWKFKIDTDKVRLWPTTGWGRGCGNYGSDPPIIRGLEIGEASPNELPGYQFFAKGKLKDIRLGISTREDMSRKFGSDCDDGCNYDGNWEINAEYISEGVAWVTTTSDTKGNEIKNESFAKKQFVGTLGSLSFYPKTPVSFNRISFPRSFANGRTDAIGDAWGVNGFEGAVHTSFATFADGYGLKYLVYDAETFNNLANKPKDQKKRKKGDLIEIEYSIPEGLKVRIYDERPVIRQHE